MALRHVGGGRLTDGVESPPRTVMFNYLCPIYTFVMGEKETARGRRERVRASSEGDGGDRREADGDTEAFLIVQLCRPEPPPPPPPAPSLHSSRGRSLIIRPRRGQR